VNKNLIAAAFIPFLLTLTACGGGGSDSAGTSGSNTTASDITAPIITLIGESTVTIEAPNTYTDEGATASDNKDGDITSRIAVVNSVDTNAIGSYTVTYTVSDAAGNAASQVTRTVNVVDTTAPVITLIGDAIVAVEAGINYVDAGATATDSFDGSLTPVVSSTVDTNVVDSYTVTYSVSDSSGNAATEVTRTVNVESIFHVSNTPELRDALDIAATNGFDDTIILADGVYKTTDDGHGVFTYQSNEENKLTIKGSSPENVILSGDNANPILRHSSTKDAPLFLEKLTFKDGLSASGEDGFIIVEADYTIDVNDCNFIDNKSNGNILEVFSNALISNSRFENNKIELGASLYIGANDGFNSKSKITNSIFIQNTFDIDTSTGVDGAAVNVRQGSIEVTNSLFDGNSAGSSGGAIYSYYANIKITDSTFRNNTSKEDYFNSNTEGGGAIYGLKVDVLNSVFESNVSSRCGGAIYSRSDVRIENSIIANNSADEEVTLKNGSAFNGCSGGGVWASGVVISLNSLYKGNSSAINIPFSENNTLINNIFIYNSQYDIDSIHSYDSEVATGTIEKLHNNYIDESRLTIPYFPSNNVFDEINLGFIDEANGDYRLTSDSGLIDIGTTAIEGVNFPETDIDGKTRISGDAIDIGPYEYQYSN
jgi:predicted outer membrane repeat protein